MKRKILSLILAVVMVLCLLPAIAVADDTTPENASRLDQNQTVKIDWSNVSGRVKYYTIIMPYDGVFNMNVSRTSSVGEVEFRWVDNAARSAVAGVSIPQQSIRAGEYTLQIRYDYTPDILEFSWFYSACNDTSWTGTVDAEPNDTSETAISIAPNIVVTGNVNTRDITGGNGQYGGHDEVDYYKFTVTSTAEIELQGKAVGPHGWINTRVAPIDTTAWHSDHGVGQWGVNEWSTRKYILEPGEYKIYVSGSGGSIPTLTGYELSYSVLSGSVSATTANPSPVRAGETITQNVNINSDEGKYYIVTMPYDGYFHFDVTANLGGEAIQDFTLLDRAGNSMGVNFVHRSVRDSSFTANFPKFSDDQPLKAGEYLLYANTWVSFARGSGSFTFSYTTTPATGTTSNLPNNMSDWAVEEVKKADEMGLIPDVLKDPSVDYTKPITRAEFAAVSVKVYEALSGTAAIPAIVNPFTDTRDVEVLKAYNVGVTTGVSATTFEPDTLLNREQAATMLTRVFKRVTIPGWTIQTDSAFTLPYTKPAAFADDNDISDWAKDSVYFMVANEIIRGVGNNMFAPKNTTSDEEARGYANATREQALIIAVRMVENLK